ncbi:hypothetical protein [Paractinoplanes rishiriensis]|uniref:Uncharacterized protein n=1 Tax=Paractinoplanes rishiriensis TaxID=1050105 RepID=A0A919JYU1_9ACTN|nr:hypothetical protein [Actinoplanes rishiriensis]GIE95583.1 hypothetical protein Ari01nite_30480 [Actinoplanes rishiriensis]
MSNSAETIRQSVRNAFLAEVSEDFVLQFLAEIRANMRDAEKRSRRTTGLMVVLAAAFELINRGDLFLVPVGDPFGQAMRDARFRRRNTFLSVAAWLRFPLFVMVPPAGAMAFEVYAFVQLFGRDDISLASALVAAAITAVLLTLAGARVLDESPHGGGPWRTRQSSARAGQ